jgi:hypothetical protein
MIARKNKEQIANVELWGGLGALGAPLWELTQLLAR